MFGALVLMPIEKIDVCLSIIKARSIQFTTLEKNINDFLVYFEKTWLNGVEWMRPKVWNYFDYIGRRTKNDLGSLNKQANAALREKKPSKFKIINFLIKIDSNMTTAIHDYRENSTCPAHCKKDLKRISRS